MGTHPIFESDFDCLTVQQFLEVKWFSLTLSKPDKFSTPVETLPSRSTSPQTSEFLELPCPQALLLVSTKPLSSETKSNLTTMERVFQRLLLMLTTLLPKNWLVKIGTLPTNLQWTIF